VAFLLAHLSDAHIGPLPVPRKRELVGKRFTGWLNWTRGRRRLHDMDVLAGVVDDIHAHRPDHIAMTGDILNIGLPSEFPLGSAWLETLGPHASVSFVPGNHDAYVRGSMPHLMRAFAPWTGDLGAARSEFPYLRRRGSIALIGLSSGLPTAPFLASGRLGAEQLAAFARLLDETAEQGLFRVVMIHHPPVRAIAGPARGLMDAGPFEAILRRHGAELVIHGHNHRFSVAETRSRSGATPVVGVASASAVPGTLGHRAGWNLYEIERTAEGWRVEVRVRSLLQNRDEIGDVKRLRII
jgi:3',5'-cyclic AMP phosphodiesterase CpdA